MYFTGKIHGRGDGWVESLLENKIKGIEIVYHHQTQRPLLHLLLLFFLWSKRTLSTLIMKL